MKLTSKVCLNSSAGLKVLLREGRDYVVAMGPKYFWFMPALLMRMSNPLPATTPSTSLTVAYASQSISEKKYSYINRSFIDNFQFNWMDFPNVLFVQLRERGRIGFPTCRKHNLDFGFRSELFNKTKSNPTVGTSHKCGESH